MSLEFRTLKFYADNAKEYAKRTPSSDFLERRSTFMAGLTPGAKILELGCGGGHDALAFIQAGFDVTLLDGSPELAAITEKRTGHKVLVADFSDINFKGDFDGIWASASLLHVPSKKLKAVLILVAKSLRKGGLLNASFKEGEGDWTDGFGHVFCGINSEKLIPILIETGFQVSEINTVDGFGSDMKPTRWIWVNAIKVG
ncbi:MAG: class I SAM-dependent methyltransferase [Halopseudomonas aestusnigri]